MTTDLKLEDKASQEASQFGKHLTFARKLRAEKPYTWNHHRGGWTYVGQLVKENLHTPDGVLFVSAFEDEMWMRRYYKQGPITEPWVGFIHQMPYHHLTFWDLDRLVQLSEWKESIKHCLGLWTLTDYQKNFLQQKGVPVPIAKVFYPVEPPVELFSYDNFVNNSEKQLLFVGEFLRNFQAFYDLDVPGYEKLLLQYEEFELDRQNGKLNLVTNNSVKVIDMVNADEYDKLLANNIVFINLLDAGANTTIVECIARRTPILVNRVGGVCEYLGKDYPFYYETLEEAQKKLSDLDLIHETTEYLSSDELQDRLKPEHFLRALQNTSVYMMLPVPRSQASEFKTYDVSLIMCQYKRVYNLEKQLMLLAAQDFEGTFELIIWNNNAAMAKEVSDICQRFADRLNIKVIHSSENLYCAIRMSMASLIRSDLLLICDDDVLPRKEYISTFVKKYREYGPEAVICARGHVFFPHEINHEEPEQVWNRSEFMEFFDESQPDRLIHFMHADNCLIPKSIMKRASQYEMERYDYILVDDYWLSYVLSHHLSVPIWKIKADDAFEFTDCADDESIAMFHNDRVNEQRINFYIYHMHHGWPPPAAGSL